MVSESKSEMHSQDADSQERMGLDSVMQPLKPEKTRQPLSSDMLRQNAQDDLPHDAGVETERVETVDDIVQEGQPENGRNVVDRQINIANRSAS